MAKHSPFLDPGPKTSPNTLALLHLKRDHLQPLILRAPAAADDAESDEIANTRFGSFPHSTLLDLPWGTQVLASNVNAPRNKKKSKQQQQKTGSKRKRDDNSGAGAE